MTQLEPDAVEMSDADLIASVRNGNLEAYGELFSRHVDAANRLANALSPSDADDLVSESFSKVLSALMAGGGPDVAFRPYLLTAVRSTHIDRLRGLRRTAPTDDNDVLDVGTEFQDTALDQFEGATAAKAFASLPERWQLVLWHLEVEGQKPAAIAPLLGMSANSVSALAYRAREGLRQAYLQMHAADLDDAECTWTHSKLGAFVRQGLSKRDTDKVQAHLDGCRECTAVYLELIEVNDELGAILAPLVLGGATAAYVGTHGSGAALGVMALLGRARDAVAGHAGTSAMAGAALTVGVVATTVGITQQPKAPAPQPTPTVAASVAPAPAPAQSAPAVLKPRKPIKPKPSTTASSTPTPTPVITTSATPTSSPTPVATPKPPPAPTSADTRIGGWSYDRQNLSSTWVRDTVRWTFGGIPTGKSARVTVRTVSESARDFSYSVNGRNCSSYRVSSDGYGDFRGTCDIQDGDVVTLTYEHNPSNSAAHQLHIDAASGLNDPKPGNNDRTIQP